MSSSAWPSCPDPDYVFARALLICGPLPARGFQLTRDGSNRVSYVVCRGTDAKEFSRDIQNLFRVDIRRRYAWRGWTGNHTSRVAQMWKNEFFIWLWKEIDRGKIDAANL